MKEIEIAQGNFPESAWEEGWRRLMARIRGEDVADPESSYYLGVPIQKGIYMRYGKKGLLYRRIGNTTKNRVGMNVKLRVWDFDRLNREWERSRKKQ